jgi:hypothetical protein
MQALRLSTFDTAARLAVWGDDSETDDRRADTSTQEDTA